MEEIINELKKLEPDVVYILCTILIETHSIWNWRELLTELKQLGVPNDRS